MAEAPGIVIVIDDDPGVREALGSLLRSVGLQSILHGSVAEFLKARRPDGAACLVLDVRLPGQGGLDLQRELSKAGVRLPIIFITGHGDIPMSVQAMKGGAIDFITKPFRDQDLLDAIQLGLEQDRARRENEGAMALLRARFDSLTQREREVMALVVTGRLNKQIAADIGLSEITVKVHRGNVMRKMAARSLADLVLMAQKLKVSREEAQLYRKVSLRTFAAGDGRSRSSWATATGAGVLDIGSIIGRIASGGVGGNILMMIVGLIKQAVEQKAA